MRCVSRLVAPARDDPFCAVVRSSTIYDSINADGGRHARNTMIDASRLLCGRSTVESSSIGTVRVALYYHTHCLIEANVCFVCLVAKKHRSPPTDRPIDRSMMLLGSASSV